MTVFTFGAVAFGELPASLDRSVADPFMALLRTGNPDLIYLVELYPYDTNQAQTLKEPLPFGAGAFGEFEQSYSGGVIPVYLSDSGFLTTPADSKPNVYFDARLDNPMQYETSIISGDQFSSANQSYGAIVITNGDGAVDRMNDYYWMARRVIIKAGAPNFRYSEFSTVFDGASNTIEADDERITITVQDNRIKLDQLLMPGLYSGTGGLEGGTDLVNKPKPLCYGTVKNVEPVLVNAANLIYQLHDGAINSISDVRDSGVSITYAGDTTNIQIAMLLGGTYITDLSRGLIRLASTPAGRVTVDLQGENGNGGYVSATGDIVKRIMQTRLGTFSFPDENIDTGSLNRLNLAVPGAAGIYITDRVTAAYAIETLINPIGGYWLFSRQGQFVAGVINAPGTDIYTIGTDDIDDEGVGIIATITPSWRISVGYAPSTVLQSGDELAGNTSAATRAFVTQEYRFVTAQDDLMHTYNPQVTERVFRTNLANQADAQDLLTRLVAVFGKRRRVYRVPIYRSLFRLYVGDTVKLFYDRYGMSDGRNLVVVGIGEDAETGVTTLQLWG